MHQGNLSMLHKSQYAPGAVRSRHDGALGTVLYRWCIMHHWPAQ